jgi:hypothetical protein
MNEFDIKAAEWDKNPMHWDQSEAIANEIKAHPFKKVFLLIANRV